MALSTSIDESVCPSCGTVGASFSKKQRKKPHGERRCKACVGSSSDVKDRPTARLSKNADPRGGCSEGKVAGGGTEPSSSGGQQNIYSQAAEGENDDAAAVMSHDDTPKKSKKKKEKKKKAKRKRKRSNKDVPDESAECEASDKAPPTERKKSPDRELEMTSGATAEEEELEQPPTKRTKRSDNDADSPESERGGRLEEEEELDDAGGKWSPMQSSDEASFCGDDIEMSSKPLAAGRLKRGDSDDSGSDNDGDRHVESIAELKHKIMGRKVQSIYDVDHAGEAALSSGGGGRAAMILDPAAAFGERGASVAAHLKQDLSCPICHDRFHEPVSLLCGHTFCRKCLSWWLERQGVRLGGEDGEVDGGDDEDGGAGEDRDSAGNRGSCPACRRAIHSTKIGVNTALRSVMMALYGSEMNQRRLAEERERRKATGGENGGLHERGNEVIEPFREEDELRHLLAGKSGDQAEEEGGWIRLYAAGGHGGWTDGSYRRGSGCSVALRRNIVLDDVDQRYQLSLGLTRCNYIRNKTATSAAGGASSATTQYGTLDVEICLLAMEEDEVDDSGFPPFVAEGDDDEALVCTGPDRVHSCVESSVRLVPALIEESRFGSNTGDKVAEVPLSRGMIGRDGSVRFRIDLQKAVDGSKAVGEEAPRVVKLRFHHVDTGAALELRLPTLGEGEGDGDEIEFRGVERDGTKSSGYMMDDDDDEDHEAEPNMYQEDDFLVQGTQSDEEESAGDEEAEESLGEEGEVCEVCRTGGDLIVCDGGDNEGGCGRAFHLECITLRTLPEGDWICKDCARQLGFNVGVEGHEWKDGGETNKASDDEVIELDAADKRQDDVIELDGSVDDRAPGRNGGVIELDDDSDDEVKVVLKKNKRLKRNTLEESDSD